ncbi:MAG: DUF1559 domain-containing protein [Planctomycetia bacterium]
MSACRDAARCMTCRCNMKQLGIALYYYESTQGKFPPAFISDESGRPMHSWRVLLMPYIESNDFYDTYDFEKPWDSPENRKIFEKYTPMHIYHCPSDSSPRSWKSGATSYVAVLGEDTFWRPDGTPRKAEEITKGVSNTPVLIEIDNSGIPWGEPRDVKLDDFLSGKLSWSESCVHTHRFFLEVPVRGRNVAFADGSVRFMPDDLTPEQLRQFFSITEPFDVEKALHCDTPGQIEFRHKVFWVWLATLFIQFVYIFFPTRRKA